MIVRWGLDEPDALLRELQIELPYAIAGDRWADLLLRTTGRWAEVPTDRIGDVTEGAAGADALLLSMWRVPDEPTRAIMDAFYDARQRGAAAVDALRGAALAARDTYGHDRLDRWAGFQLIGDWR